MCIYLTTRHVHRDGSADSVTAEWELCSASNGSDPCSNKQRRERIVSVQRHKRNTTLGSIATGSTISSAGPVTPTSSYRDESSVLGSSLGRRGTPSSFERSSDNRWSPLADDAIIETRRPSRSPARRHRRYRMSIDATLGSLSGPKPLILQPHSPSSTASRAPESIAPSSRPTSVAASIYSSQEDAGNSAESVTNDGVRAEARDNLRREERNRRRDKERKAHNDLFLETDTIGEFATLNLTQSQEKREYEEQMWDAHEQRTARRMDIREQIRDENRRKRLDEDARARQASDQHVTGDSVTDARKARQIAELEVQEGIREQSQLERTQLLAERAVLERRIALASIEREEAEDGVEGDFERREENDLEQRRRLRRQIHDGRNHVAQDGDQKPARFERIRAFAHGRRRSSDQIEANSRAQQIRARIEESERTLDAVEARIQLRRQREAERQRATEQQRQIRHLERKIETLDRKIAAREQRIAAAQKEQEMGRAKANVTAGPSRRLGAREPIVEAAEDHQEADVRHADPARRHHRTDSTRDVDNHIRSSIHVSTTGRRGSPSRRTKETRVSFSDH